MPETTQSDLNSVQSVEKDEGRQMQLKTKLPDWLPDWMKK